MARKESSKKYSAIPPATAPKAEPSNAHAKKSPEANGVSVPTQATDPKVASAAVTTPAATASSKVTPTAVTKEAGKPADHAKAAALITALRDGDADVASDAAAALGQLGDRSAVEPLIEVLVDPNGYFHSVVRAAAASSLAELGDRRAVEPLLNAIGDPMAEASAEAVRALATLGDRRAVVALIDVVRNASGFYLHIVRRAAVLALAKLGGDEAMTELQAVAANSWEDEVVRNEAIQATQNSSGTKKAH